jgi:hypothetical protein
MFKLDEGAMNALAKDKNATGFGILFVIIAGICFGIGLLQYFPDLSPTILIGAPLLFIIISFIGMGVLYFFSEFLGAKGPFAQYYRAYSHMYVFNILAIIPFIGFILSSLIGIWQIIMAIYITKSVRKINLTKAAIVVLIPVLVIIILAVATSLVMSLSLFARFFWTFLQPTV